jgi:hypothetical protein
VSDPHVVLQLCHVFFRCSFLGKIPGQHELGFEYGLQVFDNAVEGCCHPSNAGMPHEPLHVANGFAGIALVPGAIKFFGCLSELHEQILRQIYGCDLAALLAPEPEQIRLIAAHDDSCV